MKTNFKRALQRVVAPKLADSDYQLIDLEESTGVRSFYFRKRLWDNMYAFVDFHLMEWTSIPNESNVLPRRFTISLWRNHGETPRSLYAKNDMAVDDWLYMSLSYLIAGVLNINIYNDLYFEWKFKSSDELILQLQDATESLLKYGIPWLENPETRNVQ